MSNDPYRDDPYRLGGSRPPEGPSEPTAPPETAWMPPSDPTVGAAPEPAPPPMAWPQPPDTPSTSAAPDRPEPYQSPQYYQPPPGQPYQGQPVPGQPYPGGPRPTNSLAIAALVCSLAGVVTLISAPVGAVLGHLATRQIAQTGEEGAQLAKAAIWVGWIITGLVVAACCAALAIGIAASRSADFR